MSTYIVTQILTFQISAHCGFVASERLHLSTIFPRLPLNQYQGWYGSTKIVLDLKGWNFRNFPFSHTSFLEAISAVMLWSVAAQKVPQACQHLSAVMLWSVAAQKVPQACQHGAVMLWSVAAQKVPQACQHLSAVMLWSVAAQKVPQACQHLCHVELLTSSDVKSLSDPHMGV